MGWSNQCLLKESIWDHLPNGDEPSRMLYFSIEIPFNPLKECRTSACSCFYQPSSLFSKTTFFSFPSLASLSSGSFSSSPRLVQFGEIIPTFLRKWGLQLRHMLKIGNDVNHMINHIINNRGRKVVSKTL